MRRFGIERKVLRWLLLTSTALLLIAAVRPAFGDELDGRIRTGIKLFRSIVAADLDLDRKTSPDGTLVLVVFHSGGESEVRDVMREIEGEPGSPQSIRHHRIVVRIESDPSFPEFADQQIGGIFIAEKPPTAALNRIIRFGIHRGVIVYSPFEGHVEQGVLGGLSIGAKVEPYVNLATLRASGIELKEFFLKVTKVHR